MTLKNVILAGATGMIGGLILKYCLESEYVQKVTSIVRKPSSIQHPKLHEIIHHDFTNYDEIASHFENQDVTLFCIGVYTGSVSREIFRKITVDFPINLAKKIHEKSPNSDFILLSGAGADRSEKSKMMFALDKGIAENQLTKIGFQNFYAFRPSYIYPVEPRPEPNFSYQLMRFLYKPLIRPFGKKYSITSVELAQAMFQVGIFGSELKILENADILKVLNKN